MTDRTFGTLNLAMQGARCIGDMPRRWLLSDAAELALRAASGRDALGLAHMTDLAGRSRTLLGLPYEVAFDLDGMRWELETATGWNYRGALGVGEVERQATPRVKRGRMHPLPARAPIDDIARLAFWLNPKWSGRDNLSDPGTEPFWMR